MLENSRYQISICNSQSPGNLDPTLSVDMLALSGLQQGLMVQDYSAVGLASYAEAEKSLHRSMAFAVLLVLAHLLDIRPSEFDALGLKFVMKDAIVLYGFLAMLFGFYLSQFLRHIDRGTSLFPMTVERRQIRANLRTAYRTHMLQKAGREKPLTPKQLKRQAWSLALIGNIVLLPYRLIATCFVLSGIVFAADDLFELASLIWNHSRVVSEIGNLIK